MKCGSDTFGPQKFDQFYLYEEGPLWDVWTVARDDKREAEQEDLSAYWADYCLKKLSKL